MDLTTDLEKRLGRKEEKLELVSLNTGQAIVFKRILG